MDTKQVEAIMSIDLKTEEFLETRLYNIGNGDTLKIISKKKKDTQEVIVYCVLEKPSGMKEMFSGFPKMLINESDYRHTIQDIELEMGLKMGIVQDSLRVIVSNDINEAISRANVSKIQLS
jgi:hypothetical protein